MEVRCINSLDVLLDIPYGKFFQNQDLNEVLAKYLIENHVAKEDFNQYGTRRGNHEVMMRGTFANIRIKNQMVPGVEGGYT